ncbi:MBL fold metallo-hydrolase [Paenibacillus sp. P25]|nr:MBL fold metallo-hydrolase [Paenibacillus sp. P25]
MQFIDVGQGDSILIRSPVSRSVMLVDGGGTVTFRKPGEEWKTRRDPYDVGRKLLVPLLKKRGVQRIDYMLLTHQDADHFGGLQAVLEQIPVNKLLFNGTLKPGPEVEKLFRTALDHGTELVAVHAGTGSVWTGGRSCDSCILSGAGRMPRSVLWRTRIRARSYSI